MAKYEVPLCNPELRPRPVIKDTPYTNFQMQAIKITMRCSCVDERNITTIWPTEGMINQYYEVKREFSSPSFFKMDRCATCLFGILNYGVDITGYVKHPTLGICLWFQKRAANKQTWPGYWDNMVGGGLSVGHGILETAHKESQEEASVSKDLTKNLVSAGSVSFFYESERGLFPNTVFTFEIELPLDFTPVNADGEVDEFELLPASQVLDRICSSDFKTTSVPVVLDFLIRHGIVNIENEKELLRIIELLHVPLQSIYNSRIPQIIRNSLKENGENGSVKINDILN